MNKIISALLPLLAVLTVAPISASAWGWNNGYGSWHGYQYYGYHSGWGWNQNGCYQCGGYILQNAYQNGRATATLRMALHHVAIILILIAMRIKLDSTPIATSTQNRLKEMKST
ncbi:MAG: hypothetical protein WAM14_03455 [Candidatus Nitrosopolaris sp.]